MDDFLYQAFGPDEGNLTTIQMMVRAVVTFILALVLLRVAGQRSFGSKSAFDLVLSITLGSVLSRGITGHHSYSGCVAAAGVLALMHRVFAMGSYYSRNFRKLVNGSSSLLFSKGRIHWKNMRQHNLTEGDLSESLHKYGYMNMEEIEEAYFETDGKITMIPKLKNHVPGK